VVEPLHSPRVEVLGADPLATAGIAGLLRSGGIEVDGPGAARPEVRVLDGLDVAAHRLGTTPVLVLVSEPAAAHRALAAGAAGVLDRSRDGSALAAAVRALAAGLTVLEPEFVPIPVLDDASRPTTDLTPRELDVLSLLAEGLSNPEIAARLGVRPNTAKFHVQAILDKLGAKTRTEAVVLAARDGLVYL